MKPTRRVIPVVAGVIEDATGRILLAQRPPGKHLAGCWEFPGGKVDAGESEADALVRELDEELGLEVEVSSPLMTLCHHYSDRSIRLLLRRVDHWSGLPRGNEGQAIGWFRKDELAALDMPEADRPIVRLLGADPRYSISASPDSFADTSEFLADWRARLEAGFRLLQLRAHDVPKPTLRILAAECAALARQFNARWLLNGHFDEAEALGADGVHLSARVALGLHSRPKGFSGLVGVSCHTQEALMHAAKIDADFACLSPVQATASHPGAATLGWDRFAAWCAESPLPVVALGGLSPNDLERARECGAFGVAGIRGFR